MNSQASITALMSSFGRAFHTENEVHPVFVDSLAKELDDGRRIRGRAGVYSEWCSVF